MTQHPDPKHPFSFLSKDPYEFMRSGSEKARSLYSSWNEIAAHLFRSQQAYMQSALQEWWQHSMRYSWPYNYWTGDVAKPVNPEGQQTHASSHKAAEKDLTQTHHPMATSGKSLTRAKAGPRTSKPVRKSAGRAPKG